MLHRRYDPAATAGHLEAMVTELRATGATVATFTLPDLSPVVPLARIVRARLDAYNEAMFEICERTGAIVFDLASAPITRDPRAFSIDRLHASTLGHERIAAGMCEALGLPGSDGTWADALPAARAAPAARRRGRGGGVGAPPSRAVARPPRARPLVRRRAAREGAGADPGRDAGRAVTAIEPRATLARARS